MQFLDTSVQSVPEIAAILASRPEEQLAQIEGTVREILSAVRTRRNEAIVEYTRKLDWPDASSAGLEIALDRIERREAPPEQKLAAQRILDFHKAELAHHRTWRREFGPGIELGQLIQPLRSAGIYVPGGKAVYPSTVLMASLPAVAAGVTELIFCTPANAQGQVAPVVLDAIRHIAGIAQAAGASVRAFKLGGAVAIAAMAYGSQTVPQVDIIVGPGNHYVNIAKRIVYGDVAIDMLAGPSDVAIIADDGAQIGYIAADLLAQTEHGPENRGVFLTPSKALADRIAGELKERRDVLSRKSILELSSENLFVIRTRDLDEAAELASGTAPEHLELQVRDPAALLPRIRNAGAILLGDATSAPIGDYMAGPSHTLPTGGAARFSSPLSAVTFLKRSSILAYSASAAGAAAETAAAFAESEGFDAHAAAARARLTRQS